MITVSVAIDGTEVTYGADIKSAIKDHEVGDEIEITVVRDGKYVTVAGIISSAKMKTTKNNSCQK